MSEDADLLAAATVERAMRIRTQPLDMADRTLPKIRDVLGMQVRWFSTAQSAGPAHEKNFIMRANQRRRMTYTNLRINEECCGVLNTGKGSSFERLRPQRCRDPGDVRTQPVWVITPPHF